MNALSWMYFSWVQKIGKIGSQITPAPINIIIICVILDNFDSNTSVKEWVILIKWGENIFSSILYVNTKTKWNQSSVFGWILIQISGMLSKM